MKKIVSFFFLCSFYSSVFFTGNDMVVGVIPYFYYNDVAYFVMCPLESEIIIAGESKILFFYDAFSETKKKSSNWGKNWNKARDAFYRVTERVIKLLEDKQVVADLKIGDEYHLFFYEIINDEDIGFLLASAKRANRNDGNMINVEQIRLLEDMLSPNIGIIRVDSYKRAILRSESLKQSCALAASFSELRKNLDDEMRDYYPILFDELLICKKKKVSEKMKEILDTITKKQNSILRPFSPSQEFDFSYNSNKHGSILISLEGIPPLRSPRILKRNIINNQGNNSTPDFYKEVELKQEPDEFQKELTAVVGIASRQKTDPNFMRQSAIF